MKIGRFIIKNLDTPSIVAYCPIVVQNCHQYDKSLYHDAATNATFPSNFDVTYQAKGLCNGRPKFCGPEGMFPCHKVVVKWRHFPFPFESPAPDGKFAWSIGIEFDPQNQGSNLPTPDNQDTVRFVSLEDVAHPSMVKLWFHSKNLIDLRANSKAALNVKVFRGF